MTNRKFAIENGLTKYNTGKPCKNGHFADRYTSSGACRDCLAVANTGALARNEPATAQAKVDRANAAAEAERRRTLYNEQKRQLYEMVAIKVVLRFDDFKILRETAAAMLKARCPALNEVDYLSSQRALRTYGLSAMYEIKCMPEDIDFLRATEKALYNASSGVAIRASMAKRHDEIIERANSLTYKDGGMMPDKKD